MNSEAFNQTLYDITGDENRNPASVDYDLGEKRELTGETTATLSYNYLVQARDEGSDDRSVGGININLSGRQDAGGSQKKKHEQAVSDAVFVSTLNSINAQIQDKIEEYNEKIKVLDERIERIENALENDGEYEIDGDGTLRDKKLEDELRAIEDRTGKKVSRSDGEAIRAALLLQQMLLQEERYDAVQKKQELLEVSSKLQQSSPEEREHLIKELGLEEKFGFALVEKNEIRTRIFKTQGLKDNQIQQIESAVDSGVSTANLDFMKSFGKAASFTDEMETRPTVVAKDEESPDFNSAVEIYKPV